MYGSMLETLMSPRKVVEGEGVVLLRVWDPLLHRHLGLKMIEDVGLGRAEAQRMAALTHVGAVTLHGTFTSPDFGQVLLHEWVPRHDWYQGMVRLPMAARLASMLPLVKYLRDLHRRDQFHGFLNPGSVWLDRARHQFRIVDFGRTRHARLRTWLTPDHDGDRLGPWTDVFQMGLMFRDLGYLLPQIDEWIDHCCRPEPEKRWSMHVLHEALRDRWSDEGLIDEMDFFWEANQHWPLERRYPCD